MELTPEERHRIYDEERARLEARQELRSQAPARRVGRGVLVGCLGLVGGSIFLAYIFSLFPRSEEPQAPPYSKSQLMDDINNSSQLRQLKDAGVIYRIESIGSGVAVVVGSTFYSLAFDQKKGACMMVASVVGETRGGDSFVLYDYRTNKKVGFWSSQYGLDLK